MATKVTDFIPQGSWISKWFNTSQDEDTLDNRVNPEDPEEFEEDVQQPPPSKRPRIRMDVIHPPGTFSIQPRVKTSLNSYDSSKEQYSLHNEMSEDFLEAATAGPSDMGCLISSTPAIQTDIMTVTSHRSDLNSLVSSTNNGTTNCIDDNSESSESTSGCSSLIPQVNRHEGPSHSFNSSFSHRKRFIDDKLTFSNLQSSRSLFLETNRDTLSNRRPSFNASVVTGMLDRASPLSSPFYSGNTTFGGANTAGLYKRSHNLFNHSSDLQLKVPRRANVEVKPSNATGIDSSGMSQTAKKILEALEHFSSPISDAKKIPVKNASPLTNKKRGREKAVTPSARIGLRHMTRELTVPTVPDILKLRRRQKLQDTTVAARRIVSARSDQLPPSQEYRLRTEDNEDNDSEKHQRKLKVKSKVNLEEESTVVPVNLPNIPLPISTLPNFKFILPPSPHVAHKMATDKTDTFTFASPIKVTDAGNNLKSINNFTFSNPINAEDSASNTTNSNLSLKATIPLTDCTSGTMLNFIWSGSSTAPRLKEKTKYNKDVAGVAFEMKSGSVMDVLSSNSNKTNSSLTEKSNPELTSVKAVIDKTSFTTTSDKKSTQINVSSSISSPLKSLYDWECSECLIRNNNSAKQCAACKLSRPNPDDKISSTSSITNTVTKSKPVVNDCFGSQYKLSTNQWQCVSCCAKNKQSDIKCTVCSAVKSENISVTKAPIITISAKPQNSDLMDKFKPAEGSWECSGCLLRNATNIITCPCCNTSKPTSIHVSSKKTDIVSESTPQELITQSTEGTISQKIPLVDSEIINKFKPSKDSWECPGCLVRNNSSVNMCPCCSTAKPNSIENSNKTKPASTANPVSSCGFGDQFKKPEGAWNCDSCMLQNDSKQTKCIACQALKPGTVKSNEFASSNTSTLQFKFGMPSNTGEFHFGIDKADKSKSDSVSPLNGFKFGNVEQNSETAQFTFGIPKKENKSVNEISKTNNITTSSSDSGFQFNAKKSDSNLIQQNKQSTLFNVSKSDNLITTTNKDTRQKDRNIIPDATSVTSFTFGIQKTEANKSVLNNELQKTSFANTVTETSKLVTVVTDITSTSVTTTPSSLLTPNNTLDTKSTPLFSFGVPTSVNIGSSNTSMNTTTTCLPSFAQSPFTFPDSKTTDAKPTLRSFGEIMQSKSTALATNVPFAENTIIETAVSKPKKADVPVSNTSATSFFPIVSSSAPVPSLFDNKGTTTTIAFGTTNTTFTTTKPSGFVMPENKILAFGNTENKSSIFGTAGQTLTANPLPAFGTSSNATTSLFAPSNIPVFGNNTSTNLGTATTPVIFPCTTKTNETNVPNPSLFTFGSTATQTVQSTGNGFNFSANVNPVNPGTAQKPLFTFGSNSTAPQDNNLFGSTFTNPAATNTANFSFNMSKQDTPAFGQGTVTPAIFGTPQVNSQGQAIASFPSTSSSNTGFNFGSTAPSATPSEGFNFGGVSSTSTLTGGFNFNSPTSTSTITFDPNTRPSFNFTKGTMPAEFNAPPQTTKPAGRKIKKAFRRCMR